MLTRIVLFLGISAFFVWDYFQDKKPFKIYVAPLIVISFFASTDYYVKLDERLRLVILVIFFLILCYYAFLYNHDYKVEKFREKKRLREIRESERNVKTEELMQEILDAKHSSRGINTDRVEITLDMKKVEKTAGQLSFVSKSGEPEQSSPEVETKAEDVESPKVLENQLDMFK